MIFYRFVLIILFLNFVFTINLFSQERKINFYTVSIAVVDVQLILHELISIQNIEKKIIKEKKKILKTIQDKRKNIKNQKKNLVVKKNILSKKKFTQSFINIEIENLKLDSLINKKNVLLNNMEISIKQKILKSILNTIHLVRKEKNYSVVLDKKNVLSFNSKIDITYDVLNRLKNKPIILKNY